MGELLARKEELENQILTEPMVGYAKIDPFGDRSFVEFEYGEFTSRLPIILKDQVVLAKDTK